MTHRNSAGPIAELQASLRVFAARRAWEQFHSPKNIASALVVEAGELLEIFQWLSEARSWKLSAAERRAAAAEIADVFIYLVRLADLLGVDVIDASRRKLLLNARKYPIRKSRGTHLKYTRL